MSKIGITLLHAHWCGHCINFMDEWNKMKNNEKANKIIKLREFEESEIKESDEKLMTINGKEISGYPTIKINILNREYDYKGERKEEEIYKFIFEKLKKRVKYDDMKKNNKKSEYGIFSEMMSS